MSKLFFYFLLIHIFYLSLFAQKEIHKYEIFEIELNTPVDGNPFRDVELNAIFKHHNDEKEIKGFYDGDGRFIIRFMPYIEGEWSYNITSNREVFNNRNGIFTCIGPKNHHGPVRVYNTYHFQYDDGTPFYPFGTTSYAWIHQPKEIQEQTLKTLEESPFNKIRMCVFPKWYEFNRTEPEIYPYEGIAPDNWNYWKFDPKFFHHLEQRTSQLDELGIECDLILFHPYDEGHWGFDRMTDEQDDFYLRYIISRLAPFKNIWWSLANEYDFMDQKQMEDWDRILKIIEEEDPYNHLRSIHNGLSWYDHSNPLITHLSIQQDPWENGGVGEGPQKIDRWKEKFGKPVIIDEMKYEGNIRYSYGDLSADEMTSRFWYVITKGAYATHGETYMNKEEIIWWSRGGKLVGGSPDRISFLREIVEKAPHGGFEAYLENEEDGNAVRIGDDYYLFYFGARQPAERMLKLPNERKYRIDIIDTWEMSIEKLESDFSGNTLLNLPGKPYMAIRAIAVLDKS